MGLTAATAMVVGIIVGAFIFVQPSEMMRLVPDGRGVILAWLVSGLLTLCAALVCAELSWLFPETGGVYVFLKRIYSPALAFLWGWGMFWVMHAGILAAIAVVLARYAGYFTGRCRISRRLYHCLRRRFTDHWGNVSFFAGLCQHHGAGYPENRPTPGQLRSQFL